MFMAFVLMIFKDSCCLLTAPVLPLNSAKMEAILPKTWILFPKQERTWHLEEKKRKHERMSHWEFGRNELPLALQNILSVY